MFRVKICGITSPADGQLAAKAGADAVGLNFHPGSPRCLSLAQACEIAAALPPRICKVGVFVNTPADQIRRTVAEVPLDLVQLHGDEPPEFLREIRPLPVLRAVRVHQEMAEVRAYLEACHRLMATPRMLLVDAAQGGQFGGTGTVVDWDAVVRNRHQLEGAPLVLAGGLSPENVAGAIQLVRPWAVDVASGVESEPGRKSPARVEQFVEAAYQAFACLTVRS